MGHSPRSNSEQPGQDDNEPMVPAWLGCGTAHLNAITSLSKNIPSLRIILDHCASVKINGKAPPNDWLTGINTCAQQPHLYCKVSALAEATGNRDGTATSDPTYYKPVLDALWNTFGDERVVYGSNWPVSLQSASYAQVQAIAMTYASSKGLPAAKRYFAENALAFYKYVTN